MTNLNKFLGRCGIALLFVSLFCNPHTTWNCAGRIDCNYNEELFLAIAAIRNDTDANQWFISRQGLFAFNKQNENMSEVSTNWRKATVEELIEYFKEN